MMRAVCAQFIIRRSYNLMEMNLERASEGSSGASPSSRIPVALLFTTVMVNPAHLMEVP